jgi:hypothetical protein
MPYGVIQVDTVKDSLNNVLAPASARFTNRLINGAMVIDQRNAGAAVTPTTGVYLLDRWAVETSQNSKFTYGQNLNSATLPTGFSNYLGCQTSTAYTPTSSDYFLLQQKIEGFNVSDLGWGTANAKTVTLSFQVYSSLTGTFGGNIQNSGANRFYPFSYTIPVANTWTTISVTIAGDTSGTWLTTSGVGLIVRYGLGVGSTYLGTAGSWGGTAYFGVTGQQQVVATSSATFYLTGVQLEVGSNATSFEYRPYGTELALCQRYFYKNFPAVYDYPFCNAACYTTGLAFGVLQFPVVMRTSPTVSLDSATSLRLLSQTVGINSTVASGNNATPYATEVVGTYASITQGSAGWFRTSSASSYIQASAEL